MLQMILVSLLGITIAAYLIRLLLSANLRRADYGLLFALLVTLVLELLDLLAVSQAASFNYRLTAVFLESLLPLFWLSCSVLHARRDVMRGLSLVQWVFLGTAPLVILFPALMPISALYYAPDFPAEPVLFLLSPGYFYYLVLTGYLLVALVNLEKTLTTATGGEFWRIKFEVLGVGLIIATYVVYFSQGILFRSINMQAVPLRTGVLILAVFMMIFSRFRQDREVRIQVSRQFAFNSLVLLAFGAYLLFVGLLGEGMQYLGIPFGKAVVATLAIFAGVLLIVLLLSGKLRRQTRVLLHKNFYQSKHDYRTQWLAFTSRLASTQDGGEVRQVILKAYCEIFGIRGAALFLFDEEQTIYSLAAVHNMHISHELFVQECPLVQYLYHRQWVFNRKDIVNDVESAHGDFLTEGQVSFVIPLHGDNRIEGFIVLGSPIDEQERYIYEDFDLMKTIARQATVSILNHRLVEQVARMREVEAIGNISTFVIHDLKNHVAALSLLVDNARQYLDNPDFQQDLLRSLDNTVFRMQGLIGRLKNLGEKELLNVQRVDLLTLAKDTLPMVAGAAITVEGERVEIQGDAEELQKVLLNFLINAVEASSSASPVRVETGSIPVPFFRVSDQGGGMSVDFQQRQLFKPFVTTKKKGLGIGLYQCRRIIEAHGGRIEVQSEEGRGSVFTVWLPKDQEIVHSVQSSLVIEGTA